MMAAVVECSDCSFNHVYSHKVRCYLCGLHMHEEWCEADDNYPKVYYDDDYGRRYCIKCVQSDEFLT